MCTYYQVTHGSAILNLLQDVLYAKAKKIDRFGNLNKCLSMVAVNMWKQKNPTLKLCVEIAENKANISAFAELSALMKRKLHRSI
jgi:ABC-type sulfate transport system permease subunit